MLKVLRKKMIYLLVAIAIMALAGVVEGYIYIQTMHLMDLALIGNMSAFKEIAVLTIALTILLIPLNILVAFAKAFYKKKSLLGAKEHYIRKVYQKNINEFQKENNADYLSALSNDFNTLEAQLIDPLYEIAYGCVQFGIAIWLMSTVNIVILFFVVGVMGLNMLISSKLSKLIGKEVKERSDLLDGYTRYIKEVLSAFQIVKSNNLSGRIHTSFNEKSEEIQHKGYLIDKFLSFIYTAQNTTGQLSFIFVLAFSGYLVVIGKATIGGVILIVQSIQKVMEPLWILSENIPKLFTVKALIEKMEKGISNTTTIEEDIQINHFQEEIGFKEVDFSYEDTHVLSGANVSFKQGGKYLIIGPSGGGKSTVLRLLRKYFNPTGGKIELDGQDFSKIKKESYFNLIANIEQQVFLFEDTLRNNITLYKNYSDSAIEEALQKAGLDEFIQKLPQGLESMIYENGKNLSGGERSRVVIARALLAKAKIIYLDEAFAALDAQRAKEIERNLLALKDVTIINISHVLFEETKLQYDGIFVVKNQKITSLA
jgi:ATP-binding cassette subfamily C protein